MKRPHAAREGATAEPPAFDPDTSGPLTFAPAFLTLPEVAARWQVSRETVRRFVARGDLTRLQGVRAIRIAASSVTAYEARCQETKPPAAAPEIDDAQKAIDRAAHALSFSRSMARALARERGR